MKKYIMTFFSVFTLILLLGTLVSCKPDNGEEAKEKLEELGYTVEVITGLKADATLLGISGVNEVVKGEKKDSYFTAILFESKNQALDALDIIENTIGLNRTIVVNDKWVFIGDDSTDDARKIFD